MQRLAETQAARLEQELLNRRYQLMLIQIEQGRVQALQPRSRVRRFWDAITGARTPFTEAIATAGAALKQEPGIDLQYDYHYQQGRAAFLSQNTKLATAALSPVPTTSCSSSVLEGGACGFGSRSKASARRRASCSVMPRAR